MEELKLNDLNSISNSIANEVISNVRAKVIEAFDMGWTRCEDAVINNFSNGNYSRFNLNYLLNNMLNEVRELTSDNYIHHKASLEASINNIRNLMGFNDNVESSSIQVINNAVNENTTPEPVDLSKNNVANAGIEEVKSNNTSNNTSTDIFVAGEEYVINQAENEEAKLFLLGKKLHVYSANCSCPGNKIKIDAVGIFTQCSVRDDGEYLYTFSPEDGGKNVVLTTRSHFIKFVII